MSTTSEQSYYFTLYSSQVSNFADQTAVMKFPNGLEIEWKLVYKSVSNWNMNLDLVSTTTGYLPDDLKWSLAVADTNNYARYEKPSEGLPDYGPKIENFQMNYYNVFRTYGSSSRSITLKATLTITGNPELLNEWFHHPTDSSFSQDLKQRELFTDFTIAIGEREFKVHKFMLAARSPVFNRILQNECQETKSNRTNIDDVDPEVFETFIDYLYTSTLDDLTCDVEKVFELLKLADMYEVEKLKDRCSDFLLKILSTCDGKTVAEIYYITNKLRCKKSLIKHAFKKLQEDFKKVNRDLRYEHRDDYEKVYQLAVQKNAFLDNFDLDTASVETFKVEIA